MPCYKAPWAAFSTSYEVVPFKAQVVRRFSAPCINQELVRVIENGDVPTGLALFGVTANPTLKRGANICCAYGAHNKETPGL